jgi:CrcB protein
MRSGQQGYEEAGTLVVNVVGAFLLGVVVYAADDGRVVSEAGRLFVSTGFLSSFTTYSTFAGDTAALAPGVAALNVVGNYALGGAAVLLAREVVQWRS